MDKEREPIDETRPLILQNSLLTQHDEATSTNPSFKKNSDWLGLRRANPVNPYRTRLFMKKMNKLSPRTHKLVFNLTKDISDRTHQENEELLDFFGKVPALADLGLKDKDLLKVVASLDYTYLPRMKTIFKKGDYGDTFYIVIKGEVNLYMTNPQIKLVRESR